MNTKKCSVCNQVKEMTQYYKAGKYYQKRCKPCHNQMRKNYKSSYIKRGTGFFALPEDVQEKIKLDIHNKVKYAKIARTYNISYQNLLNMKKRGIPAYQQ